MIHTTYVVSNGIDFQQVAIQMLDGSTYFVSIIPHQTASVSLMPDDTVYPSEICHDRNPTEFTKRN